MKYLVAGATGFLGTHVVAALEEAGHEVVRFARSSGGDILDGASVRAAATGCDGAFHCAGKVSRRREDAEALYRVHVEGTRTLLAACEAAGVRRVVLASTSGTVAVSERADQVATEDDAAPIGIIARWPYYRSKLFAERFALERPGPLEVVSVNPSLLLGPGDVNGSSTEDVRLFLEGTIPAVPAGGLSFVDARDAADAMLRAMDRGRPGQRYLVGACNLTVREFFARLGRVSGQRAPWVPMPKSRGLASSMAEGIDRIATRVGFRTSIDPVSVEMGQCFWYFESTRAERELGWRARDPNVTLLDTVEDLRERGVVWPREIAAAT
jgi:dihydroflavonol-4-reductase